MRSIIIGPETITPQQGKLSTPKMFSDGDVLLVSMIIVQVCGIRVALEYMISFHGYKLPQTAWRRLRYNVSCWAK